MPFRFGLALASVCLSFANTGLIVSQIAQQSASSSAVIVEQLTASVVFLN
jgi:hypothetical protein